MPSTRSTCPWSGSAPREVSLLVLPISDYDLRVATQTVSGTQRLVPFDPRRVALMLGHATGGGVRVRVMKGTGSTAGFLLNSTSSYLEFLWGKHGPAVTAEWEVILAGAGANTIEVVEVIYLGRPTGPVETPRERSSS